MNTGILTAIIILIFFSAFFGFAETSLSFVNKVRLKTMAENGNKRAARVLKIVEDFDKVLSTILVGNNIVNITIASLATILFTGLIRDASLAVTLSTIITTVVILIFAEVTPKSIAKEKPETFAMLISRPMQVLLFALAPINAIFMLWKKLLRKVLRLENKDKITDDELINYVETAEREGSINEYDSRLIKSAIKFDHQEIKDIMTPRVSVTAVSHNASIEEVSDTFKEHGFSRMPVYSETIDSVVGSIYIKDFYNYCLLESKSLKDIIQPSLCVAENMKIDRVLRLLQESKVHMAIVVDEHGGTSGIVTLEDIIEELVGEIWDEHDEEQVLLKRIDNDTFIVSGTKNLEEMFQALGIKAEQNFESITVGGWVTEQLGKIPLVSEGFNFKNLQVTVTKSTIKKVLEVKIIINPKD
ncbi:MAG: hemolysin family protein [Firmicutes bacterium]|nr:hemolysin family protein [Bacillota bacterium]